MMERTTINTNIRLNLNKPEDRQAWEYLQSMDRKKYKSYSRAVVAAINDHFSREERCASDPFLESREKEDAFSAKDFGYDQGRTAIFGCRACQLICAAASCPGCIPACAGNND